MRDGLCVLLIILWFASSKSCGGLQVNIDGTPHTFSWEFSWESAKK